MNTYEIKRPITIMRDDLIIGQLPKKVIKQLGPIEETGFHLGENRRDLFCTNGTAQYKLGSNLITITMTDNDLSPMD